MDDMAIAAELFELSEPRRSDPLNVESAMAHKLIPGKNFDESTAYKTQADLDKSTYATDLLTSKKLQNRAATQRCSNLIRMPIWRLMPL